MIKLQMNALFKILNNIIITIVLLQTGPSLNRGICSFHLVKVPVTKTLFPPNPHLKFVKTSPELFVIIPLPGFADVTICLLIESDYLNNLFYTLN